MREYGSLIGNEEVFSDNWLDITNPYTGEFVGRVNQLPVAKTIELIEKAASVKLTLSRYERQQILTKMADAVSERVDEISLLITDESGLCLQDTRYEASRVADVLRFAAIKVLDDDSQVFPCDISPNGRQRRIYTTRQPLKLISAITPFNHPMNQVIHKIAPAIATNNTVVLKPSERTPLSAYYLAKLAYDCGLPAYALNVVNGPVEETCRVLVSHEDIDLVSFTGSSEIGRNIAINSGYKKLILELGGSSPLIIAKDADVDEAVDIAIAGTFKNSAQRCTAIRRILVHESLADSFAEKYSHKVSEIKFGNPYDESTQLGCVINSEAASLMEQRVNDSIAAGAQLLCGNTRQGAVYSPTVLDHVTNDMPIAKYETFGPVSPIIRFTSIDEAIDIANDTKYGLSSAVVSNHWPTIQKVICSIDAGTVNVNEAPSYRLEWTPFGGIKDSGLGYKEGVIECMKAYTNIKTYSLPWEMP